MTIRKKCDDSYDVLEARIVSHIHCKVVGKYRNDAIKLGNEVLANYQALYGDRYDAGFYGGEYFSRFKQDTKWMGVPECS